MVERVTGLVYDCSESNESIYDAWIRNCTERDELEKGLAKPELFPKWCYKQPLSIIEVGCGLGSAALRFRNVLNANKIEFTYKGIDPFPSQLARFRSAIGEDPRFDLEVGDFSTLNPKRRFDLGLIIHSLYYVPSMEEALARLNSCCNKMLIVHHGYRGINEIQLAFRDWVVQEANEISTHEDVCSALDTLEIEYSTQPITSTFTADPSSEDFPNLARFFLEDPNLTLEQIAAVGDYCRKRGTTMIEHDLVTITT